MKRKATVRVIYKSGASVDVDCNAFKVKRNAYNELSAVEWTDAKPNPLHIGVNEIASIWQVK